MTDRINDGGPAFPHKRIYRDNQGIDHEIQEPGLSLRDWFAGQALSAAWDARDKGYYEGDNNDMARCAYQIADAMLEARK